MCHYLDFIKSLPFDHIFNHVLVKYRHFRGMQILANEWADHNSASVKGTGCYKTISYASKQKGDIIAAAIFKNIFLQILRILPTYMIKSVITATDD